MRASPTVHDTTREFELSPSPRVRPDAAGLLPRLLRGVSSAGQPLSLAQHTDVHGILPGKQRRRRRGANHRLIEQVQQAGLRGRGGASFPTAKKLHAVAAKRGRPIVVVNAAEGEPASSKDGALCQLAPHLVLDGAVEAALALGAHNVTVGVCESSTSIETVAAAIGERGGRDGVKISLSVVPSGYVAGQESALISHLNGSAALPTFTPPMPFEQGVRRRPTLVSNAETFANIALIARYGADWFRALGTAEQPGSALVTLSGPVAVPAVYEIEHGASLSALTDAAGGLLAPVRAILLGGYAGSWVDARLLGRLTLCDEQLADYGASLGAGVIALLSDDACPVAETARVTRWLACESAGQCGPCVHGLDALATTVAELATGAADEDAERRVAQLAQMVRRRGACAHPDGAVRFALSALELFGEEFADHARNGPCERCGSMPELPLPVRAQSSRRGGPGSRAREHKWTAPR